MDLPNVDDVSNASASVSEVSVSTPENVCNRIKKNLAGFEVEHFSPKNVMRERLCSVYFRRIEDLKFQDVLSAVTNSGVPAEVVRCIQSKKYLSLEGSSCDLFYTCSLHSFC